MRDPIRIQGSKGVLSSNGFRSKKNEIKKIPYGILETPLMLGSAVKK